VTRQLREALVELGAMALRQTAEMIRIERELAALDGEVAP
jgi:hypothetical protein